jgi:hypothetical protein
MSKKNKQWTLVAIYNKKHIIVSSFILNTEDDATIEEVLRDEVNCRGKGYSAAAFEWRNVNKDGEPPLNASSWKTDFTDFFGNFYSYGT